MNELFSRNNFIITQQGESQMRYDKRESSAYCDTFMTLRKILGYHPKTFF